MNSKDKLRTLFNVGFFLVFSTFATLHVLHKIRLDAISLSLFAFSIFPISMPYINRKLLPYLNHNFRAIEIFGIKAELLDKIEKQDVKLEQQEIKLQDQQRLINELVKFSMSASIFHHLCGIALLKQYTY